MSRIRNDIVISAFLVLILLWVVWEARSWPFRTRLFPWAVGFPVLALALLQFALSLWQAIRYRSTGETSGRSSQPGEMASGGVTPDATLVGRRTLSIAAWIVAFALGFWLFGFKIGGLLLSLVFLRFQARESWTVSVLYGLGIYLFFLLGFELALGVPLPAGVIATSIGLQSFDWYLINPLLNSVLRR
ncbi:MAG TPA: tripartite tricarboxylate transporter TctB family protein [Candidatus Binatia bacterium]|nr:tripartite tricarboxylate transporter TctB family protein [Candidatus Binatia bacterium]